MLNNVQSAALESEGSLQAVSKEDQFYRIRLANQLRELPRDALQTIRHFQTQVGCLNRCSFCSQSAGMTLWNMSRRDLANLVAALKMVSLELYCEDSISSSQALTSEGTFSPEFLMPTYGLIGNKRKDRPGVIYCYLDNDPASYPYLDDMIKWLYEDLGVKVRIATVGYSRYNKIIQDMHENISNNLMHGIAGFRLSFSPYTYGWTRAAEHVGKATRDNFERDTANLLNTYRSTFLSNQKGRKGACVELRFRPLVVVKDVRIYEFNGHLVIRAGNYMVLQQHSHKNLNVSNLIDARNHSFDLNNKGEPCWLIHATNYNDTTIFKFFLEDYEIPSDLKYSESLLHMFKNDDGEYFGVDVTRQSDGIIAKYFYPKTLQRPNSGFIDGERYLLNSLIKANLIGRNKSWSDVEDLVNALNNEALSLDMHDPIAARYVREEVIELVKSYIRVLHLANFPPSAFFDKDLSVETGHICNLGRAFHEYKEIASRSNLPLTPHHERAFGLTGELAEEGQAWRLAVSPLRSLHLSMNSCGERNTYSNTPSILMERLDLAKTATVEGQSIEKHFLSIEHIEQITIRDTHDFPMIPGHSEGR